MEIVRTVGIDLGMLREKRPLVHSITNFVVMNETANAVLCIGALPIMSHSIQEVEEMVSMAGALVLNIGTLTSDWIDAMVLAGKRANERDIPVILDPVGAGATRLRTESSKRILENVKVSIVRGNAAEVSTLLGIASEIRGVESISASVAADEIAVQFAKTYGCTAAITGPVDAVSDGAHTARISNGHPMLAKVVGTGCMSTTIVAAFAAVDADSFAAAVGGLTAFGIAGEMAAAEADGKPGTFHVKLYDALYAVDEQRIQSMAKIAMAA